MNRLISGEDLQNPDGQKYGNVSFTVELRRTSPEIVCECILSCADDPATACSLSGDWHVHPEWPCLVHPDAPGDRGGGVVNRSPMKRSYMVRRYRDMGPDAATVDLVLARARIDDFLVCELCGDPLSGQRGVHFSLHHRRGRDARPDSHMLQNLLLVHGASNVDGCHGRIHRNREGESYANGWLLSRNAKPVPNPALVPVLIWGETRWTYLCPEGRYVDSPVVSR